MNDTLAWLRVLGRVLMEIPEIRQQSWRFARLLCFSGGGAAFRFCGNAASAGDVARASRSTDPRPAAENSGK